MEGVEEAAPRVEERLRKEKELMEDEERRAAVGESQGEEEGLLCGEEEEEPMDEVAETECGGEARVAEG